MKICIFDVPLMILFGFVFGGIYAKKLIRKHPDTYFFVYWITIILMWVNGFGFHWFTEGRFIVETPFWIGFFYVLSYGIWFTWGAVRFYQLFGQTPEQGGIFWLLGVKERSRPFKGAWRPLEEISRPG